MLYEMGTPCPVPAHHLAQQDSQCPVNHPYPQNSVLKYSSTAHKAQCRPRQTPCQSRYLHLRHQQVATIPRPSVSQLTKRRHASRYDFALSPPLPQDRKQERQRIRYRDRKAQFCKGSHKHSPQPSPASSPVSSLTRPTLQAPYPPSSSTPKPRGKKKQHLPALPISKKNHTLPVKFTTNGTAYAGLLNKSTTVHTAFRTLHLTHPAFDRVSMRSREG